VVGRTHREHVAVGIGVEALNVRHPYSVTCVVVCRTVSTSLLGLGLRQCSESVRFSRLIIASKNMYSVSAEQLSVEARTCRQERCLLAVYVHCMEHQISQLQIKARQVDVMPDR
jgi:hypothetical protein